jgi:hypothetical protein
MCCYKLHRMCTIDYHQQSAGIDLTCRSEEYTTLERNISSYNPLRSFHLPRGDQKHYKQQYADMYFARLAMLKPTVERNASEAWDGFEVSLPQSSTTEESS